MSNETTKIVEVRGVQYMQVPDNNTGCAECAFGPSAGLICSSALIAAEAAQGLDCIRDEAHYVRVQ